MAALRWAKLALSWGRTRRPYGFRNSCHHFVTFQRGTCTASWISLSWMLMQGRDPRVRLRGPQWNTSGMNSS